MRSDKNMTATGGMPEHKNVFRLLPRPILTGGKKDEDNRLLWRFQHLRI